MSYLNHLLDQPNLIVLPYETISFILKLNRGHPKHLLLDLRLHQALVLPHQLLNLFIAQLLIYIFNLVLKIHYLPPLNILLRFLQLI